MNVAARYISVRCVLAAVSVLLASVSNARAENITYNLVNYPVNQADYSGDGVIMISGTIVTDGTLGALHMDWQDPDSHVVGGSISYITAGGSFADVPLISPGGGILYATPTALTCPVGYGTCLHYYDDDVKSAAQLGYYRFGAEPDFYNGVLSNPLNYTTAVFRANSPTAEPGSIGANDPWVVATAVPEPSSVVLLFVGAASLLAYAWRRRPM